MHPDSGSAEHSVTPPEASPPATDAPAPKPETAAWHLPSHLRLWLVAAGGLALDLWTKHLAFTRLDPNPADEHGWIAIRGLMSFRRSLNPGALFGLGKGLTPIFIAASILALSFVLFLFINSGRNRRSLHVALALVLAGALGNLYDRAFEKADVVKYTVAGKRYTQVGKIVSQPDQPILLGVYPEGSYPRRIPAETKPEVREMGVVRDFIKMEPHFQIAGYKIEMWPWVFNIADALLVVGVSILMLNFWWERKAELADQKPEAAAAPDSTQSSV